MCGIAGFSGHFPANLPQSMADRLAHRGPDDAGLYICHGQVCALVHRRLSIIDLSPAGHQPMLSPDGSVGVVFNGEIYNYRELRAGLLQSGVEFRGNSDTEVLLHLYLANGRAMLPLLNGVFAFAILDQNENELWLVRDAFGVKPLYWSQDERGIAFASEIKALPIDGVDQAIDDAAVVRYLRYLWCPGEGTPLQAVRKVNPGEWLRIREGKVVERKRWYVPPLLRSSPNVLPEAETIRSVHDALRAAVHRQMVADVPVGAFLSGGLDSSAVVTFAREETPNLRCFTIATPDGRDAGETDDLPYARRVASHLGVQLDVVEVDAARMAAGVERMAWQLDEPLADPAPLNVLFICELARQSGIKVLLSGAGGDDLFTGYRRHLALDHERIWRWLPRFARRGLHGAALHMDQRTGTGRRLAKLFAGAELEGDERLVSYFEWAARPQLLALFRPEVRARLQALRPEQPMLDFLADMQPGRPDLDRMLALEQRFFLADHNLTYTDKMSMAVGVEARVPFLDLELVELAARIPAHFKQRGSEGKWVLKKAMEPHLPREVIYRPKTGFGAPLRRWLRHELRELLLDTLAAASLRRRGLFDPTAVHQLIADDQAGRCDASYVLFSLMCIEIWCRRFIDEQGKAPALLPSRMTETVQAREIPA